jgi:hypothetical protein
MDTTTGILLFVFWCLYLLIPVGYTYLGEVFLQYRVDMFLTLIYINKDFSNVAELIHSSPAVKRVPVFL